MLKKILKITGIVFLVLFLAALVLPFIFKDKIIGMVTNEANKNLNAVLKFDDLDLSLIRSFPNLSIGLEGLSLANVEPFKGDTLISAGSIRLTVDLLSALSGDEINIKSVKIDKARIHLNVLADGKANWDITKPSEPEAPGAPEEPSAFKASLRYYSITNSRIVYDDRTMPLLTVVDGLNHEGSGDFTADFTNLATTTSIDALDVIYGGVTYLKRANIHYKADFALDLKNSKYEFKENELKLNDLLLKFAGYIAMPGEDITMDITYEALKNEVKSFISLVPGSYTADFKDVKSSGKLGFDGYVKGTYNEKSIPGFAFNLLIENGMIQYPGLPRSIGNMQVKAAVTNPGGDADRTVVDVSKLHVDLGQFPIDAKILVKTPVSDPDMDVWVKGRVDLANLKDLLPLDSKTTIGGVVNADATFRGRMSSIEKGQYDKFYAAGNAGLSNFSYAAADLPQDVKISTAALNFNPAYAELSTLQMYLGKSDISASGKIEQYLGYILKDQLLKGSLTVKSNFLDLNPFMTETTATPERAAPSQPAAANDPKAAGDPAGYIRVPANIDFTLNAAFSSLLYDNMKITNAKGQVVVKDQTVSMKDLFLNMLGGSITVNGSYDTRQESGPEVNFDLNVKDVNIKETAKTFNTIKQLAPVAENTTGNVSSRLHFSAKADPAFNILYPTLNGGGNLQTSLITIEGFDMVKKTAEALKMDKLKKWQLEKLNASFTIREGKIFIEPFDTKIGNYKATIGGSNSLDQSINYAVNIEIPRAEFGGQANAVLNNLVAQANAKGIQAQVGDIIPVALTITGTFKDPKVKTDIRQQAGSVMNDLKAQAEQKLKEEADRYKKELEAKANAEKQRLQETAEKEKERLKAEADKAKQEAERKAKEEAEKAKKKAAEEAKKGLDNLFKKK